MKESIEALIAQLGVVTGLGNLRLDDENRCGLLFDGSLGVELEFDEDAGELIMSTVLGAYALDLELPALRAIAGANVRWAGTGGGTLAADTIRRLVMLQYREPVAGLTAERFFRLIEGFLDTAGVWRERLGNLRPDGAPPDAMAFHMRA